MKIAVITPVYKKESQSVFNNTQWENCVLLNLVQKFVEIEGPNRSLKLVYVYTINFYIFYCPILKSTDV